MSEEFMAQAVLCSRLMISLIKLEEENKACKDEILRLRAELEEKIEPKNG